MVLKWGPIDIVREKFDNIVLFLWSGLPPTVICHKQTAFQKCSSNQRSWKTQAFRFCDSFTNTITSQSSCALLDQVFLKNKSKWKVIVVFLTPSSAVWMENIWCNFRLKPLFSNLSSEEWTGPENKNTWHFLWPNTGQAHKFCSGRKLIEPYITTLFSSENFKAYLYGRFFHRSAVSYLVFFQFFHNNWRKFEVV